MSTDDSDRAATPGIVPDSSIEDVPPSRTRDVLDPLHACAALLLGVVVVVFAAYLRGTTSGVEHDVHNAGRALEWLMDVPASVIQQSATVIIVIGILVHLLRERDWLELATSVIAMFCGYGSIWAISFTVSQLDQPSLLLSLDALGSNSGTGLLPDMYAGMAALLTVAGPRAVRTMVKWGWNALFVTSMLMIVLSWHTVVGVIVSFCVGRIVGLLFRFAIGTQNKGLWGIHIVRALHRIGIDASELTRLHRERDASDMPTALVDDDLIEHSRIYQVRAPTGDYIVSVLDNQAHSAGYLSQIWQWIRFTGISVRHDRSAADANHHHLAMLLGLHNIGLQTPPVYGVADAGESSILVFEAPVRLQSCDVAHISDDDARDILACVLQAHRRGYSHRAITAQTLARTATGRAILIGWHHGNYASSPVDLALDKVQLLSLLSACIGVSRTLASARQVWGERTLIDVLPYVQKTGIPNATRQLPMWNGNVLTELRESLTSLVPEDSNVPVETIPISRFSLRSFLAIAFAVIAVAVVFTQLRPNDVIAALQQAKPAMAALSLLFSILAWIGSALTLGVFIDADKRHYTALFLSQVAQGFTSVSMPAGVGPAVINLQYLRKLGYRNTPATAIMSVTWAIQALTTLCMVLLIGLFSGSHTLTTMIPTNTLIVVIGATALIFCTLMAISPVRRLVLTKYVPMLRVYVRELASMLSQPRQLIIATLGALVLNVATGLGFWASLLAFGYHTNPAETIFIFLLANTLGSAVPTPGGLGAVEAAVTFAFTSVGVPPAVALSATLLYRVAFYWLRIPMGMAAMRWLARRNLI